MNVSSVSSPILLPRPEVYLGNDRTAKSPKTSPGTTEPVQAAGSAESQTAGPSATEPAAEPAAELIADPDPDLIARIQTLEIADQLANAPLDGLRDDPDFDFYQESSWFSHVVLYFLWLAFSLDIAALLYSGLRWDLFRYFIYTSTAPLWEWTPFVICWLLMCFALFLITIEDIGLHFRDSLTLRVLSAAAKGVIYFSCSFMHLFIGIGIPSIPFDVSNPSLPMVVPGVSLSLVLLVMIGSESVKARLGSGLGPIRLIAEYALPFEIYLACVVLLFFVFDFAFFHNQFSENFAWLYLVIPPGLYVMICLIYWGSLKIRAFTPTFRRNR